MDSPAPSFLPFPLCGTSYANAFSQVVDGTWLESFDSRKERESNQSNRKENGKSSKSRGGWPISQRSSSPTDQLPNLLRIYAPTEKSSIPLSLDGKGEVLKEMAFQAR